MKMSKSAPILLIIASVFLFSCQKSSDLQVQSDSKVNTVSNINKSLLLELVNNVRQTGCNCGTTVMPPVAAVVWNDQLEAAALSHAADMSANNYFSHTGLNGSNPGTRIANADYTWRAYGENIAKGYYSEQAVIDAWLASEGHCKNIMNAAFNDMGVATVNSYWVQEFGAK